MSRIDEFLEDGQLCPRCDGPRFETVQVTYQPLTYCGDWELIEDNTDEEPMDTIFCRCAACGHVLWDIQAELEEALRAILENAELQLEPKSSATPERDADRERSEQEPMTACDNCGHQWRQSDLEEPKDIWQRLDPGAEVPAGECPACGALCYLIQG